MIKTQDESVKTIAKNNELAGIIYHDVASRKKVVYKVVECSADEIVALFEEDHAM